VLLRELQPIQIFAAASIGRILREDNSMFSMLNRRADQARWHDIAPGTAFKLFATAREQSQIECLPLSVATRFPSYVITERAGQLVPGEPALGLILRSESGKRLGYFPAVGQLNQALLDHLDSLDMLLFDGTFWSDDELITIQSGGQTARQMGHIPVSSATGSLDLLSKLCCPRKIFVHINNTNPMLDVTGPENHQVSESGWEIAKDGCHLEL